MGSGSSAQTSPEKCPAAVIKRMDEQAALIKQLLKATEDLKSKGGSGESECSAAKSEGKQPPKKVALLTAGGLAPCLSSAVGGLIQRYTELFPEVAIICYAGGYKGLLLGDSYEVTPEVRKQAGGLHLHGGSPIGNSRVKLTNVKDCVKRKLVKDGEDPLKVAADQLVKDGVDVLHTIGGDDTNLSAADLAAYLKQNDYSLIVIGLPKTIDNDVFPIKQTLGAWTAAEEGSQFFSNVVNEQSANHRMLIVHEIMGRSCGYLTAATARQYREALKSKATVPSLGLHFEKLDVHAVYLPEIPIDIEAEAKRLTQVMDACEVVNIFVSEGAGVDDIVKEMESRGQELPRDAFGHVKLDAVNPGAWFASRFAELVDADKTMVQKSGYYGRAAPANRSDLNLIKSCCDLAVDCAAHRISGVIGHDEDDQGKLRAIEFPRIKGGKPFDVNQGWFREMMAEISSPVRLPVIEPTGQRATYIPKPMPGVKLPKKVAILSAGGLAPCVSSAIGGLIERYNELYPSVEIICYQSGFRGLLMGKSIPVTADARRDAGILHLHGGSPLGNSRVKLTNKDHCVLRGLCSEEQDPQQVAVDQLLKDEVEVLHTIGGDTEGANLADFLKISEQDITVIGLPKTIDNDVFSVKQTLGAYTAAEEGAKYFANVVYENSANPRMLIVHEVMGAFCGYLTAATANVYRGLLDSKEYCPGLGLSKKRFDVHAVFLPEMPLDIQGEANRLKGIMEANDSVNIFLSEGAGFEEIAKEIEARGEVLPRTAQGKIMLDAVKPGEWFAKQFAAMIGAEKVLVQKSGYYTRSAPANAEDLRLIKSCTDHAVECALRGVSGVVGHDEDNQDALRAIEFERVKGGKPFKTSLGWFQKMLSEIGQQMDYADADRTKIEASEDQVNNLKVRMNVIQGVRERRSSGLFK